MQQCVEKTADPILLILLGASNLSRAYYGFIKYLERCLYPRPVRFFNALGPGRAYCAEGGLLNFVYPPIGTCGILAAARGAPASRAVALVTDIGSDIMYDVPTEKIIAGLADLFEKLHAIDAAILATAIPQSLEKELDGFRFWCLRTLFYPKSRVGREQVARAVCEINRFLKTSANIRLISGLEDYYGVDKIHFSLFKSHRAWTRIAKEVLRILNVESTEKVGALTMMLSLGSQVLRLTLCDMAPICDKDPDSF